MGVSTDGILFFGIDLGDDEPREDGEDWQQFVAAKLGVKPPSIPYNDEDREVVAIWEAYWAKRAETIEGLGCTVGDHCCIEDPSYYVALSDRSVWAHRDYPEVTDQDLLTVPPDDVEKLKHFCGLLEIPWTKPQWHLASWWAE